MSIVTSESCECPIFNADCFNAETGGTVSGNYVEFPTAQGNTTVQTQTVLGTLKLTSDGIQANSVGDNLNIGTSGNSGRINLGKINATLADSVYVNSELRVYGTVLIDSEGIQTDNAFSDINIGTTSALNVNLGKTDTPTNVNGNLIVSSLGINAASTPLTIQGSNDYAVSIGVTSDATSTTVKNRFVANKPVTMFSTASVTGTLGVTGITTAAGGLRTLNINSTGTSGAAGRLLIGTIQGADSGTSPSIDMGILGNTMRINCTKVQLREIDTITGSSNILSIGLVNAAQVNIKDTLYTYPDKVTAANTVFATTTSYGGDSYIDTVGVYSPIYIAPSPSIYPDAKCGELFLGNETINTTMRGGTINIGEGGTVNIGFNGSTISVGVDADTLNIGSDITSVTNIKGYAISIGENTNLTDTTVNNQFIAKQNITVTGDVYVNQIDAVGYGDNLLIGQNNAGTVNIKNNLLVAGTEIATSQNYVSVDSCYFTTGTGSQATIDTKTPLPLHIAPSVAVQPNAVCSEVVLGNDIIPVEIASDTLKILVGGSYGGAGNVLTSDGTNTYWGVGGGGGGGTTIQSGETLVLSSTTGSVTYSTPFPVKPKIMLTYNLNGSGPIIPVAVSSHIAPSNYTGFNWIAATTSITGTISWYVTQ